MSEIPWLATACEQSCTWREKCMVSFDWGWRRPCDNYELEETEAKNQEPTQALADLPNQGGVSPIARAA